MTAGDAWLNYQRQQAGIVKCHRFSWVWRVRDGAQGAEIFGLLFHPEVLGVGRSWRGGSDVCRWDGSVSSPGALLARSTSSSPPTTSFAAWFL